MSSGSRPPPSTHWRPRSRAAPPPPGRRTSRSSPLLPSARRRFGPKPWSECSRRGGMCRRARAPSRCRRPSRRAALRGLLRCSPRGLPRARRCRRPWLLALRNPLATSMVVRPPRTTAQDRVKPRSMPVEFRVLGPLEIRRDGATVRASKQRTFLGALLVNHGRVVSVDRLVDGVWPDGAPSGGRHARETQASRLRFVLGDDAPLVARTPGYVLEIDAQLLDSVRFEQLLDEARDALGIDPARAAARAADALALRRGEPLAEFTFDSFAQEEIARLSELLLEAEELRLEAELSLGNDVAAEAQTLVAASPLRERRHAQLMLALYRGGRQADALAAYHAARETLLRELGLDPGDALRDLERAILRQDP